MPLTLQESCDKYTRLVRSTSNKRFMTFKRFNQRYGGCLPLNALIEKQFKVSVMRAKRQNNDFIHARFLSLRELVQSVSDDSNVSVSSRDMEQHFPEKMSSLSSHPRPYKTPEEEPVETDTAIENDYEFKSKPESSTEEVDPQPSKTEITLADWKEWMNTQRQEHDKLNIKNNMIVHFVPKTLDTSVDALSLSAKLTKSVAEALSQCKPVKLRDGTTLDKEWSEQDVKAMMSSLKAKESGPFYVHLL